jgi:hypothetical protein
MMSAAAIKLKHADFKGRYTQAVLDEIRKEQFRAKVLGELPKFSSIDDFEPFPALPTQWIIHTKTLAQAFLQDFESNKPYLLRELQSIQSRSGVAVVHQRKVVKRVKGLDNGRQSFSC